MKRIIVILAFLTTFLGYSQTAPEVHYVEGLALKNYTTTQLNTIVTKEDGDMYYDLTKKAIVYWADGAWKSTDSGSNLATSDQVITANTDRTVTLQDENSEIKFVNQTGLDVLFDSNGLSSDYTFSVFGLDSDPNETAQIMLNTRTNSIPNFQMLYSEAVYAGGGLVNLTNNKNLILKDTGELTYDGQMTLQDEAYDATGWNGSLEVPTKNAVRDEMELKGGLNSNNVWNGTQTWTGLTRNIDVSNGAQSTFNFRDGSGTGQAQFDFFNFATASQDYFRFLLGAHSLEIKNDGNLNWTGDINIPTGKNLYINGVAISSTPVINTLTSTSTTSALSAAQGKVLQDNTVKLTGNQIITGTKTYTAINTYERLRPYSSISRVGDSNNVWTEMYSKKYSIKSDDSSDFDYSISKNSINNDLLFFLRDSSGTPVSVDYYLSLTGDPVNPQDLTDKEYVDSVVAGGGTDDQTAAEVPFTPYSTLASTNVQDAIEELLDEGSGGISDGDKGDITVSGSGANWNVDSGAITSTEILDGTILNADINASAAIDAVKIALADSGTYFPTDNVEAGMQYLAAAVEAVPTLINSNDFTGATTTNVNSATGTKNYVDTAINNSLLLGSESFTSSRSGLITDADGIVIGNSASAITYTVPTNASVPYPIYTVIKLKQVGAGNITLAYAGGVTGEAGQTYGINSEIIIRKIGTNTWEVLKHPMYRPLTLTEFNALTPVEGILYLITGP